MSGDFIGGGPFDDSGISTTGQIGSIVVGIVASETQLNILYPATDPKYKDGTFAIVDNATERKIFFVKNQTWLWSEEFTQVQIDALFTLVNDLKSGIKRLGTFNPKTNTPPLPLIPLNANYDAGDYYEIVGLNAGEEFTWNGLILTNNDWAIVEKDGNDTTLKWDKRNYGVVAKDIFYNNSASGKTSTNLQDGLDEAFTEIGNLSNNKVDKVTGKGLSTEDYTTAEKNKLANIQVGAEVNVQADLSQTDSTQDNFVQNKSTAYITDSTDKRYITDAQQTVLQNTRGINTGDETNTTILTKIGFTPENVANKITAFPVTPNDTMYASAKLIKDSLDSKQDTITGVADQSAMLALTNIDVWHIVKRQDLNNALFQLIALPASTLANWEQIAGGSTPSVKPSAEVNVSETVGNDTTGDGSLSKPYRTALKALQSLLPNSSSARIAMQGEFVTRQPIIMNNSNQAFDSKFSMDGADSRYVRYSVVTNRAASGTTYDRLAIEGAYIQLIHINGGTGHKLVNCELDTTEPTTLSTPPSTPSIGEAYKIGASPTGAWAGFAVNSYTYWSGTAWINMATRVVIENQTTNTLWNTFERFNFNNFPITFANGGAASYFTDCSNLNIQGGIGLSFLGSRNTGAINAPNSLVIMSESASLQITSNANGSGAAQSTLVTAMPTNGTVGLLATLGYEPTANTFINAAASAGSVVTANKGDLVYIISVTSGVAICFVVEKYANSNTRNIGGKIFVKDVPNSNLNWVEVQRLPNPVNTVASASTINLDSLNTDYVNISGTTNISAITLSQGKHVRVRFAGSLTLVNSANLVLPSGANIVTRAFDYAHFVGELSGSVRCVAYVLAQQPVNTNDNFIVNGDFLDYIASAPNTNLNNTSSNRGKPAGILPFPNWWHTNNDAASRFTINRLTENNKSWLQAIATVGGNGDGISTRISNIQNIITQQLTISGEVKTGDTNINNQYQGRLACSPDGTDAVALFIVGYLFQVAAAHGTNNGVQSSGTINIAPKTVDNTPLSWARSFTLLTLTPPSSPGTNTLYVVGASTGAWSGFAVGTLVQWNGTTYIQRNVTENGYIQFEYQKVSSGVETYNFQFTKVKLELGNNATPFIPYQTPNVSRLISRVANNDPIPSDLLNNTRTFTNFTADTTLTAFDSVDYYNIFVFNQTTPNINITLPRPTIPTTRPYYCINNGTIDIIVNNVIVAPNKFIALMYFDATQSYVVTAGASNGLPAGVVVMFLSTNIPNGFLEIDGSTFNATTYPLLFIANGNSNVLKDFRGRVGRGAGITTANGMINGVNYDAITVGAYQNDDFKSHTHNYGNVLDGSSWGMNDVAATTSGPYSNSFTTTATGGVETRQKAIGVIFAISTGQ